MTLAVPNAWFFREGTKYQNQIAFISNKLLSVSLDSWSKSRNLWAASEYHKDITFCVHGIFLEFESPFVSFNVQTFFNYRAWTTKIAQRALVKWA